jgi:hypothetical protein
MQILNTRSRVSFKRFYESFTSNKWCESYEEKVGNCDGDDEVHKQYVNCLNLV